VFDLNAKGQYLPLVWVDNNSINYSGPRFGLSTVVGTPLTNPNEAINCIPAVVGAALAGIDKQISTDTIGFRCVRNGSTNRTELWYI